MKFIPRPYQEIAIDHVIKNPRCALWLPMGAGKSASVLTALDRLSFVEDVYPALILAPYRVANNVWPGEMVKWDSLSHLEITPALGTASERLAALRKKSPIITCNYENAPWLVENMFADFPFKTIVCDESTALKSFRTRQGGVRPRALSKVAFSNVKRFINLTGTPTPQGLTDLYGQTWFLDQGERLGKTYAAFEQRWFQRGWNGYGLTPLPNAQKEIMSRLSDICLSIDLRDYFNVSEPVETTIEVELPPAARRHYKDMETKMFMEIEGNQIESFNAASKTNRCSQLANGAAYLDPHITSDGQLSGRQWKVVHEEKITALESIVAETSGAPLLVVYNFKSDLARLLKHFPKGRVFDKNIKTENDWNAGKIPLLFVHPKSAGHGSNLQYGGHHIVYFGLDWGLEGFQQVLQRIGPIRQLQSGLNRLVYVYYIIAKNTIDEDMLERLKTKESVQNVLLKAMKRRKR